MGQQVTRRTFTKAGAVVALGAASPPALLALESHGADPRTPACDFPGLLDLRPYQLLCIVCRLGDSPSGELDDPRLNAILRAVRQDPKIPIRLRCNVESLFRYQNPGDADDTPEGTLFNAKRDLDVLQRMGLVPGDTRPARDLFERLLANISTVRGICTFDKVTSAEWRGCPRTPGGYEQGHQRGLTAVIPARPAAEKAEFKKQSAAAIYQAEVLRIRPHHLMCMSCFFGGREKLAPIAEDNLFEAIDVIQKRPDIPVTLVPGCCMICPPCSAYDPKSNLCLGGRSMGLRDQKKDLDVLQRLGKKYGDTQPARQLYQLLYERVPSVTDICGYGDGQVRAPEWSVCGSAKGDTAYQKARAANLGIPRSPTA